MTRKRRIIAWLAGLWMLVAAVVVAQSRVVETIDGEYGRLQVLELKGLRILTCDEVIQGAVPVEEISLSPRMLIRSGDYIGLIPYFRPGATTALVLGLGAGVHDRSLKAVGMAVHNVDIDPAVVTLARKHFGFDGNVSVADARALSLTGRSSVSMRSFSTRSPAEKSRSTFIPGRRLREWRSVSPRAGSWSCI